MKRHFVEFLSPGTMVAESNVEPIDSWNVDEAVEMAHSIVQRYNARPYGFRFITRKREEDELDSKIVETSGLYYLGGRIETLEQVKERADPDERILLSNMEINGYDKIVINENSYKWTQPLEDGDTVLDVKLQDAP